MNTLKILQVIGGIYKSSCGKRTRFEQLISQTKSRHFVYSTCKELSNTYCREMEWGVNWCIREPLTLRVTAFIKKGALLVFIPLFFLELIIVAIKNKISIIHAHNADILSIISMYVARFIRKPFIIEFHGLSLISPSLVTKRGAEKVIRRSRWMHKKLARSSDVVIVQTSEMKKSLIATYHISGEKITILENIVDLTLFNPQKYLSCRDACRSKWGYEDGDIIFLYAGFLDTFNGVSDILNIFSELLPTSRAYLIIAGNGYLKQQVLDKESENIERINYLGTIEKKNMPEIYAATDVVLLARPDYPETREATPIKLLEAMAMEKLVVCSDVKGLTRICDKDTGVIIPPGNYDALKETVERVEMDFASLKALGKKGREKIIKHFSSRDESAKLDDLYLTLAGR